MPQLFGLLGTLFTDIGLGSVGTALGSAAAPSALSAGLGAAAGIAPSIVGLIDKPGSPTATTQTPGAPTPIPTGPTPSQISASQQVGSNVTSATSGFVSPGYTQAIMELLNGPSGAQQASNNIYGTPG